MDFYTFYRQSKSIIIKLKVYDIFYFHETLGHIKFSFSNNENINSPNKFINEKNIIKTLIPFNLKTKDKNVLRILNENQKAESGTFFELIYGQEENLFIINIMDHTDNYWKIIDRVDLFLGKLDVLSKYIKNRFYYQIAGLEKEEKIQNLTIEEEIEYIEELFKINNFDTKLIDDNLKFNEEEELEEEWDEEEEEEISDEEVENKESNKFKVKNRINKNKKFFGKDKIKKNFIDNNKNIKTNPIFCGGIDIHKKKHFLNELLNKDKNKETNKFFNIKSSIFHQKK